VNELLRHKGEETNVDRSPVKPSDADYSAHFVPSTTVPSEMAMSSAARELQEAVTTLNLLFVGVPGHRSATVLLFNSA
jgi:hypothetical protein